MLPLKPNQIHRYTEKQRPLKLFWSLDALISPRDDTLIASHHNMWFATDFVPCYTWMKSCLQTLIISYISGELSSPSFQTSQLAAAVIPTFQTPLKLFTLEEKFLRLWYTILFTLLWLSSGNILLENVFFSIECNTLRNNGSKKFLPVGLRLYPQPFSSEERFVEERVCQPSSPKEPFWKQQKEFFKDPWRTFSSRVCQGFLYHNIKGL